MDAWRIRHVSLHQFRSYDRLELPLDGRSVVLTGPNGAGKTNLLEALSMFSAGRGLRHATLEELRRHGAETGWAVNVTLGTQDETRKLGTGTAGSGQGGKRLNRIDGKNEAGPSVFLDHLRLLWLTPAQDRLFMEGASERRRFLDRMTLAHEPAHGRHAAAYEKLMRQRNRALEDWPRADRALLDVLEQQLAGHAVAIDAARRRMLRLLMDNQHVLANTGFPHFVLTLTGFDPESGEADAAECHFVRLKDGRAMDAAAGRTLTGPHRADLETTYREKNQPARLCSTGEQKALLTGLILANAAALSARRDDLPPLILLLDEIAAHLDENRRASLFDILHSLGGQCFMTGTDQSLFSAWGNRVQYLDTGSLPDPDSTLPEN